MGKYFGTDGVRGRANEFLTPELAYRLGQAGANIIAQKQSKPTIIIGKDTRISGDLLEHALVAGILSTGANVIKLGVVPTPAVPYLVRETKSAAGVMISASHNPYYDNGIKFFDERGFKLADEIEDTIEAYIEQDKCSQNVALDADIGRVVQAEGLVEKYADFLRTTINNRFDKLKIVLDTANGSAYELAPKIFRDLGAKVVVINNQPDGLNINEKCGSTNLAGLSARVLAEKADLGIAYDGDADRLLAVDENGEIVDGDQLLYICGKDLANHGKLKKQVIVVTVMSNLGLHKSLERIGISTRETPVGDRYVLEEMVESDYNLGGEQSGHLIFLDYNTTGDGILSSLMLSNVLIERDEKLSVLAKEMEKYPQLLQNIQIDDPTKFASSQKIDAAVVLANKNLAPVGRVIVRLSGTEPLLRVMVEGASEEQIELVMANLVEAIKAEL